MVQNMYNACVLNHETHQHNRFYRSHDLCVRHGAVAYRTQTVLYTILRHLSPCHGCRSYCRCHCRRRCCLFIILYELQYASRMKCSFFSISNPPLAHIFTFEWNAPTVTDMKNDPTERNSIHRGDKIKCSTLIQTGKEREVEMWVSIPSGREWILLLIRANIARPNPIPFGQSSKSENRVFAAIVGRPEFRQK